MEMALVRFINFFKKAHNFVVFFFPRQQVWIVKSSFSTVGFRRESPVNQIEPDKALRTPLTPTVFAFPAWLWIDFLIILTVPDHSLCERIKSVSIIIECKRK